VVLQLRGVLDQNRFVSSWRVAFRSVDVQVRQRLRLPPTSAQGSGLTPTTSAPGLGSPCHICNRTGLTPATFAPGRGSLPHLHRDLTRPRRSAGDAVVEGGRTAYPLCGIRYPTANERLLALTAHCTRRTDSSRTTETLPQLTCVVTRAPPGAARCAVLVLWCNISTPCRARRG
jgi:hypothetical protein